MTPDPIFIFDSRERWFPVGVEESLAPFGYKWGKDGFNARGGRLNFPADMKPAKLPYVGYKRVVKGAPLDWHQYWLWYLYNPKDYLGHGRHEGDWEFVQIGVARETPILMTLSAHQGGNKREYWNVEVRDERPVVYVARDSHANYFVPGRQGVEDECDGRGMIAHRIEWREFGPWAAWDGRWGNSTGLGQSPQSPGQQVRRWKAPHSYHSDAK